MESKSSPGYIKLTSPLASPRVIAGKFNSAYSRAKLIASRKIITLALIVTFAALLYFCLPLDNGIYSSSFNTENSVSALEASAGDRPLRFTILDVNTRPLFFDDFALYQTKSAYALKNAYQIHFSFYIFNETRDEYYSRVPTLFHTLFPRRGNNPDWVFFMDHDIFFMNRSKTLESIVEYAERQQRALNLPPPEVIVSRDCNNINIGTMLFRSSAYIRSFLPKWYDYCEANKTAPEVRQWHEQGAFIRMYDRNEWDLKNKTAIVPQSLMNAFGQRSCGYSYEPGDLLVHFPNAKDLIKEFKPKYLDLDKEMRRNDRVPEFY